MPLAGRGGISASFEVGPSLGRDFHVYSVAWDPGKILWYVDDDLYHAVTPAALPLLAWRLVEAVALTVTARSRLSQLAESV
jgi:beta-glucanase (GH16 family)